MIEKLKEEVKVIMGDVNKGHGFDHVDRVYNIALALADKEKADKEIVSLAALLHDCDDYKMFGEEVAGNLTNSRNIMNKLGVAEEKQELVLDIIKNMGYSKSIQGIRPKTLEGHIVSDADMMESIGMVGSVRTLVFTILKKGEDRVFNSEIFPKINLSLEEYKQKERREDNFINHHFDKLLKLKNLMLTKSGKKEALKRHDSMVFFLREFFREQGLQNWLDFLENYEKNNK
ncbi:MAG: HD domain-containing protein [Lactobacillaceae bacterium]|jgi:uncharacterized protein|nr:HD domain-containing protein [Lactobacillaceae bacterium]